ncbi:histidine kinase [Micromonospora sp. C28SCA-DRY-2]|uniref:sensor histidine kinase n=1 Tax=Micromonospora sp. C28SCA-DRY-2 TaxID=3059522 RepID=UPI0026761377|nr:sensor histidine kinase [Micromonospora sp. C28SCA-DRY-2]MDO3703946.1 histidine kinase [Micromonospora sp. C28SCA-DRY-2]
MTSNVAALRRTVERHLPLGLALLVGGGIWYSATGALGVRSPLPGALVLAVAVAAGWAAGIVHRRRWPLFAAAAVAWLLLAAWPAGVAASWQAGLRLRGRRRLGGFLAGAAVVLTLGVLVGQAVGGERRLTTATPGNAVAMAAWLVVFPLVVGLWIRARRDTLAALRDRAARLEREQEARAERARAEERARIAREMHDVVAHRVSLMVVRAGALEVTAADPATVEAAALIRSTGRQALTDLREVLGVLRQAGGGSSPAPAEPAPGGPAVPGGSDTAPLPGLAGVDELVRESRAAGLRVERRDEGRPAAVPATVGRTVYRVVQEALTNVRKHAADAAVTVRLHHQSGGIEVSVRNGPSTAGAGLPGAGLGLVGLRERVELLGGRLEAGPRDGGFLVRALIPVEEER